MCIKAHIFLRRSVKSSIFMQHVNRQTANLLRQVQSLSCESSASDFLLFTAPWLCLFYLCNIFCFFSEHSCPSSPWFSCVQRSTMCFSTNAKSRSGLRLPRKCSVRVPLHNLTFVYTVYVISASFNVYVCVCVYSYRYTSQREQVPRIRWWRRRRTKRRRTSAAGGWRAHNVTWRPPERGHA